MTPDDTVIVQCTGYRRVFPLLGDLVHHVKDSHFSWDNPTDRFECNDRYIRPLYNHLIPTTPSIPVGSLALGCLFPVIWNLPTSYAQGLWFGHLLANLDVDRQIVPERKVMQDTVRAFEEGQRSLGNDVAEKG